MSRLAFTQFQALAQQAGIPASADSGNALLYGVHIGWAYREPQRQLQIDVNRTPFFVSDEQSWGELDPILASAQTAAV